MRKHTTILFLAGLLISAAGFMLGQATRIPFVLRIVSPSYWNAMAGYKKLSSNGTLAVGDKGFKEFARIKLQDLAKVNPPEKMEFCHIVSFSCEPGTMDIFSGGTQEGFTALAVSFHHF